MLFKTFLLGLLALLHPFDFSWAGDGQNENGSLVQAPPEGMVLVPAGKGSGVWMAQESIKWNIPKSFYIDKFEITVGQYNKYLRSLGKVLKRDRTPAYFEQADVVKHSTLPVVGISWQQTMLYCKAMGKRLPVGSEWKMAAVRKGDEKAGPNDTAFLNLDRIGDKSKFNKR